MALITRISRLFTADMNAVIDRLEEPDIVLKQALRDMQDSVAVATGRLRVLGAQQQRLAEQRTTTEQQLAQLQDELTVCLDAADDDLARNVIGRKLCLEARLKDMEIRDIDLQRALQDQRQLVEEQTHELESLRQKSELLDTHSPSPSKTQLAVSPEQVEIVLLQEKQRRLTP